MLEEKFNWIPSISYFPGRVGGLGGWVGESEIKANSVSFQLKLPVWTELGKKLTDIFTVV